VRCAIKIGYCAGVSEVAEAKRIGYDYVDLRGRELAALSGEDFSALLAELKELELPCLNINAYCGPEIVIAGPGYDRAKSRAYAEALAPRAAALGVKCVGIGSPGSRQLPEGFDRALAQRQAAEFLRDAQEVFGAVGANAAFECLAWGMCNFVNLMSEAAEIARQAPGSGLIMDFYHLELNGEGDMDLTPYVPMIFHAHISDDAGTVKRRTPLRPDKYALHAKRIRALIAAGYRGNLSLEPDGALDGAAAAESLAFLRTCC